MVERHVVVVGGGIVGLATAYFLARRGVRVTLLDEGDLTGTASTGNAGLVAVGHGPLPRPGLAPRAARWMFDGTSPLYIAPRPRADLIAWLWRFYRSCRPSHYHESQRVLMEHGRAAGRCFQEIVDAESITCGYRPVGQLDVFITEEGFRAGRAEGRELESGGYDAQTLGGDELREREPAFRQEVVGAMLFQDRAFADPDAFVAGLAAGAARHGAALRTQARVTRLPTHDGRCVGVELGDERLDADVVVLAAGVWSTALGRTAGVRVPLEAAKGYHVNLETPAVPVTTAAVLAERFVAVTPMLGHVRLAGTLELSGINHRFRARRIARLRTGANAYLHGLETATASSVWCGLRPCTADGLPVVGWAPSVPNLFVATGHAMMGFTLGPLAGRLAAEAIVGEGTSENLAPFDPARLR